MYDNPLISPPYSVILGDNLLCSLRREYFHSDLKNGEGTGSSYPVIRYYTRWDRRTGSAWGREGEKSVMLDRGIEMLKLTIRVGFTRPLLASNEDMCRDDQGEKADSDYIDLHSNM